MKLLDAKYKIEEIVNKPFCELIPKEKFEDIIKNKGKSGQILENIIGLTLSNTNLDFEDGELKSNKCNKSGYPLETMFITQISSMIDDLLCNKKFEETKLYKKIQHFLYVPISKEGHDSPEQWMFLDCVDIDLSHDLYGEINNQLYFDYQHICSELNRMLMESNNSMLHTASGKYIQIRTKDSKPYHPIRSKKYERIISDKNRAFYFKKEFMLDIMKLHRGDVK